MSRQNWPKNIVEFLFLTRRRQVPAYVRRLTLAARWAVGLSVGASALAGVVGVVGIYTARGPFASEKGFIVLLVVLMIGGLLERVVVYAVRRRIQALAQEANNVQYRLCPACAYSLVGLPDIGVCPECGLGFESPKLIREWTEFLG